MLGGWDGIKGGGDCCWGATRCITIRGRAREMMRHGLSCLFHGHAQGWLRINVVLEYWNACQLARMGISREDGHVTRGCSSRNWGALQEFLKAAGQLLISRGCVPAALAKVVLSLIALSHTAPGPAPALLMCFPPIAECRSGQMPSCPPWVDRPDSTWPRPWQR